jgi:hypothetical protein
MATYLCCTHRAFRDAVAEELQLPFDGISLERVFWGLYHFARTYEQGAAEDAVNYFASRKPRLGGDQATTQKTSFEGSTPAGFTALDF